MLDCCLVGYVELCARVAQQILGTHMVSTPAEHAVLNWLTFDA